MKPVRGGSQCECLGQPEVPWDPLSVHKWGEETDLRDGYPP